MSTIIDLLRECEYGGCSAKLDPTELEKILSTLPLPTDPRILVGLSGHDDAGVYLLNEDTALIVTTDFFPPMVSDPYTFGRIAATNALSDVYAMGGTPLLVLNLMHYPSSRLPLDGLREILRGGQSAIDEAGALTMGGHTIEDTTPQYGLAVVGTTHPSHLLTNGGARPGQLLILTKPIGIGAIIAGHRLGLVTDEAYTLALLQMQRLNKYAAAPLHRYGITGATDVTGFGLLGHGREMAEGAGLVLQIESSLIPLLPNVDTLIESACIPGASFRNLRYAGDLLHRKCPHSSIAPYVLADPQTSGGLLIAVDPEHADDLLLDLHTGGDSHAAIIGVCTEPTDSYPPGSIILS